MAPPDATAVATLYPVQPLAEIFAPWRDLWGGLGHQLPHHVQDKQEQHDGEDEHEERFTGTAHFAPPTQRLLAHARSACRSLTT